MASVLITGTSKGIGFEAALAFGRAGHTGSPRNHAQAGAVSGTRGDRRSGEATNHRLSHGCGLRRISQRRHCGHAQDMARLMCWSTTPASSGRDQSRSCRSVEFRAVMETNYFGALRCIQAVVPHMRQRGSGCIINVTSVGGRISSPPLTPYNASKWALEALSEGLAGEMKTFGVRVLIVEPGIIDTAMARRIGVATGFAVPAAPAFCRHVRVGAEEPGTSVTGGTKVLNPRTAIRGNCAIR